jgi:hypothetical protein
VVQVDTAKVGDPRVQPSAELLEDAQRIRHLARIKFSAQGGRGLA